MKAKEQAAMQRLGMFNVRIVIHFNDGEIQKHDAYKWDDTPLNLALTFPDKFVVFPHQSIKYFEVYPQEDNSNKEGEVVN